MAISSLFQGKDCGISLFEQEKGRAVPQAGHEFHPFSTSFHRGFSGSHTESRISVSQYLYSNRHSFRTGATFTPDGGGFTSDRLDKAVSPMEIIKQFLVISFELQVRWIRFRAESAKVSDSSSRETATLYRHTVSSNHLHFRSAR